MHSAKLSSDDYAQAMPFIFPQKDALSCAFMMLLLFFS